MQNISAMQYIPIYVQIKYPSPVAIIKPLFYFFLLYFMGYTLLKFSKMYRIQ